MKFLFSIPVNEKLTIRFNTVINISFQYRIKTMKSIFLKIDFIGQLVLD